MKPCPVGRCTNRSTGSLALRIATRRGAAIGDAMIGVKQDQDQFVTLSLQVMANLNFAYAIGAAMRGHRITRRGWNAAGQYVFRHHPDKCSEVSESFMAIKNAQGIFVPWVPSQGDMAAQDWAIIPIQPIHC